jgi:tetratricopeptide (TPR) repeat protein
VANRVGRPPVARPLSATVPREALESLRDLLHQLGKPKHIRTNMFVLRYLAARVDLEADDHFLTQSIEQLVRASVAQIASRPRIIIERTIFNGERVAAVARSLGISDRQVHRDQATAVRAVAERLISSSTQSRGAIAARTEDRFRLRFSCSRILEQAGRFDEACTVLSDILREVDDERVRARIHCDLSRLALDQLRNLAARHNVERARSALRAVGDDALTRGQVDATIGAVEMVGGDQRAAREHLRRGAVALRSCIGGEDHESASEILARALVIRSDLDVFSGKLSDARDAATEAQERLRTLPFADRSIILAARMSMAAASAFTWSNPANIESEMRTCYQAATQQGFVVVAIDIAIWLALIYRYMNQSERGLELFRTLLPSARSMSPSRVKATFFLSMANGLSEAGQAKGAMDMISEATAVAVVEDLELRAHLRLASARAYLLAGELLTAIDASDDAERTFSDLGRVGLVGVTLHVRGKALLAMGKPREASITIRHSIDALASAGHPRALLDARRTLSALQGRILKRV